MRFRLRCLVLMTLAFAAVSPAAHALTVGIADQSPSSFSDTRLSSLGLPIARLIVPFDAAASEPDFVRQWLNAVEADGMEPHVAFEHLRSDNCPGKPCTLPTADQYAQNVSAFIAAFPDVKVYTTWNEGNHSSQPVAKHPEMVAAYYQRLVALCPGCTVVAGDVLDSENYKGWLQGVLNASPSPPQLWGLHNYGDAMSGTATGADGVLATVPGTLWLEETGGQVNTGGGGPGGHGGPGGGSQSTTAAEANQAQSIHHLFDLARSRPRIARMYIYQWKKTNASDRFDSGLVRSDGTARPAYTAFTQELTKATAAATNTTATASALLSFTATWKKTKKARFLVVRATCPTGASACAGKLSVSLRLRKPTGHAVTVFHLATRTYKTTAAKRTAVIKIKLGKKMKARVAKTKTTTVALKVSPTLPATAADKVVLTVKS